MVHLDLFSGIGGFALAASWVWEDHFPIFCEIDPFCRKVLQKHWPDAPIHEDIRELTGEEIMAVAAQYGDNVRRSQEIQEAQGGRESLNAEIGGGGENGKYRTAIDLLTGGFPCQPYSVAGKQRGSGDDRALWPEMFRVISEVRPRWVIGENVSGFVRMGLDAALSDLESEGYEAKAIVLPACAVGAPHRRDRVWIVAYSDREGESDMSVNERRQKAGTMDVGNSNEQGSQGHGRSVERPGERTSGQAGRNGRRAAQCGLGRAPDGVSAWLDGSWEHGIPRVAKGQRDRVNRLKALGNAIVPEVAYRIMLAIRKIDES